MILAVWLLTMSIMWRMNTALYAAAPGSPISATGNPDIAALAHRWIAYDWVRVTMMAAGFLSAVRAISLRVPGRSEIRELAQQRFASARTTDFKVQRREIQLIGDSAYELAWYSETHRGQDQSLQLQGRYLIVWKRGSDKLWRVHRNLYNFSGATP